MLALNINGVRTPVNVGHFPNEESFVDIEKNVITQMYQNQSKEIFIEFKYENDSEFLTLQMLKDYIDELGVKCGLKMPYIPYSRMDRKESKRLFSLKTVARMINNMHFECVSVAEPHSDVSVALFDRVIVEEKTVEIANRILSKMGKDTYIVFPDSGAQKRYLDKVKTKNVITANKHRDFDSGKITHFTCDVPDNLPSGFKAIIVDDLCSKGYTFVFAAKALRKLGAKQIVLVVTHCEDNILNGEIPESDLIDAVYTTDSIYSGKCSKINVLDKFFA